MIRVEAWPSREVMKLLCAVTLVLLGSIAFDGKAIGTETKALIRSDGVLTTNHHQRRTQS